MSKNRYPLFWGRAWLIWECFEVEKWRKCFITDFCAGVSVWVSAGFGPILLVSVWVSVGIGHVRTTCFFTLLVSARNRPKPQPKPWVSVVVSASIGHDSTHVFQLLRFLRILIRFLLLFSS